MPNVKCADGPLARQAAPGLLQKEELTVYLAFRSVNRKLQKAVAHDLKAYGLTDAKFGVLRAFENRDSCTMSEIVPWVLVVNSGITGIVRRMERAGLLSRAKGREDARERHVRLTEKGRALLNRALPAHRQYVASIMAGFDEKEVLALEKLLAKMGGLLDHELKRARHHQPPK